MNSMKAAALIIGGILLFVVLPFACRPHPVGAARTPASYTAKAGTTAKAILSAVQTTKATTDAVRKGSFGPFTSRIISEQEEAVSKTQGTFDSIQPPNADMDALRDQLDELITQAMQHISTARIAANRSDNEAVLAQAQPLQEDAKALNEFIEAHK
jgi:hypothetical protein